MKWNGHPLEITEMTFEDIKLFLKDKDKCDECQESYCGRTFSYKGKCIGTCNTANFWIAKNLLERCEYIEQCAKEQFAKESIQEQNESASINPSYQATIDFMKNRGYNRCYMCGTKLKEED